MQAAQVLAILALGLSTLSLVYTLFKDREQNRRWDALNLARFVVRDLRFDAWREINQQQFAEMEWGYDQPYALAVTSDDGVIDINRLRIPVAIIAVDVETQATVGIPAISVKEIKDELERRITKSEGAFALFKMLQISFVIENAGSTSANGFETLLVVSDGRLTLADRKDAMSTSLAPAERVKRSIAWTMQIDDPFPERLYLNIQVSFMDSHRRRQRVLFCYEHDWRAPGFERL